MVINLDSPLILKDDNRPPVSQLLEFLLSKEKNTKKEFELLSFLAHHPNKVFSRDELLEKVWGSDVYVVERTVDVHIRKLREKIPEYYIKTLKGVGYMFSVDS